MVTKKAGLLIGCGSVGKKHALALAARSSFLVIVDPEISVIEWAEANIGIELTIYPTLAGVPLHDLMNDYDLTAVIATWGPSHHVIFDILVQAGIKKIVCEKPFSNSLASAKKMIRQAEENEVRVVVGITRRYTGFAESISSLLKEYCGGGAESITVIGGAQCVSTIGIHWLDLAFQLFKAHPNSVVANLNDGRINPRNSSLGYWEGFAAWEFPGNRYFSINLTNSSRVSSKIEILGKLGSLTIEPSGDISIRVIELDELEIDQPVTRTKQPVIKKVIKANDLNRGTDPFSIQLQIADGFIPNPYPFFEIESVLGALISAFEASLQGARVKLPLNVEGISGMREWAIS